MQLLSDKFIQKYTNQQPPFGPLGYITYKRTYARRIEGENRTEEWFETCRRVIESNFQLEIRYGSLKDNPTRVAALQLDAEQAYDDMFNLRWLPAGRSLWIAGVEGEDGSPLNNCWYVSVKPSHGKVSYPFEFAMNQLMLGGGVGFGVSQEHISKIPEVKNHVELTIVCREDHKDYQFFKESIGKIPLETHQYVKLHDSREGWVYGIRKVINTSFLSKSSNQKRLVIDISDIRPSGTNIRGFGGVASGPYPLIELFSGINQILNRNVGRKLSSIDCTDIMTMIGRCVVSGNVRRSAMIAVGDSTDLPFTNMKNPIKDDEKDLAKYGIDEHYTVDTHNHHTHHNRWASNNSLIVDGDFSANSLADSVWVRGEPGFLNLNMVQNYGRLIDGVHEGIDGEAVGTNPCGEQSLEDFEACNLVEVFPTKCQDFDEVKRVMVTAYRFAKRVTLKLPEWPESREVMKKNRRLGVSISGIQDWYLKLLSESGEHGVSDFRGLMWGYFDVLYRMVKEEDARFSARLGINESIKLTTVKPSGTISLLAGVSNGIHYPFAGCYIRRIQFTDNDALVQRLRSYGFRVTKAIQTPGAVVVQFPIKHSGVGLPGFRTAGEVSAREQLEHQHVVQAYWSDNQVSCTVSLQESDREGLEELIDEYAGKLKSTSFLPYTPAIKEQYPDLPFEPITEEIYNEMMAEITQWPNGLDVDLGGSEIELNECEGGVCPVR